MKKIWHKPKLIILAKSRPEEFVLAGCKMQGNSSTIQNKNIGCQWQGANCALCSANGPS